MDNRRHLFPRDKRDAHDITVSHIFPYLEHRDLKSTSRVCEKLKEDTEKYALRIRRFDSRYIRQQAELKAAKAALLQRRARREAEERGEIAVINARFHAQRMAAIQVVEERWRQVKEEAEREEEIWRQALENEYAKKK